LLTRLLVAVSVPARAQVSLVPHTGSLGSLGDVAVDAIGNLSIAARTANSVYRVFVVSSLSSNPTPFKGGTLIPLPFLFDPLPFLASAGGEVSVSVPGGSTNPVGLVLQAIDPTGPQFHFSNALLVNLGVAP
jgi:hypothetical protein